MNTDCLLIVAARPEAAALTGALERAAATVRDHEERFSRFLPDSELSRLNASADTEVRASASFARVLARALEYARLSDGVFDPVVLADLEALGYDRTFEDVRAAGRAAPPPAPESRYRWRDVRVEPGRGLVRRPVGARIDFGGIAKGSAADAALVALGGFPGALVDLGGDIRSRGTPADADAWVIGVEDGRSEQGTALDYLKLRDGAVATSSVRRRWWVKDGEIAHHILDPRAGRPARSGVLQCTAIADLAEHADVAAKVGFILGPGGIDEGGRLGRALGLRGMAWLTFGGEYHRTPGWEQHALRQ